MDYKGILEQLDKATGIILLAILAVPILIILLKAKGANRPSEKGISRKEVLFNKDQITEIHTKK